MLSKKKRICLNNFINYKEQQKKIKTIEKTIKDLRDWANRVDNNKFFKRAASLQKKLDKMKNSDTESDKHVSN